jgi:hypothetical protein
MHLKLTEQSAVSHVASSFLVATLPLRLQVSTPISPFFLSFIPTEIYAAAHSFARVKRVVSEGTIQYVTVQFSMYGE